MTSEGGASSQWFLPDPCAILQLIEDPLYQMSTLMQLEQGLQREVPLLTWHCQPCGASESHSTSRVPEEIEITATYSIGRRLEGSPFHLRGTTLTRWGVETTVRLICSEMNALRGHFLDHPRDDWDKLSEL